MFKLGTLIIVALMVNPVFAKLFNSDKLLMVTIKGQLSDSWSERDREVRKYNYATMTIGTDNPVEFEIKMKVRGHRRGGNYTTSDGDTLPVCDFPPLKIKAQSDNNFFPIDKSVKLVSHCNDLENTPLPTLGDHFYGLRGGNNYLLREYTTYKIQNIMTPISYRVRLAKITYIDDNNIIPKTTRYGFFLERSKDLAKRNKLDYLDDIELIDTSKINTAGHIEFSFIQNFIGNSDFTFNKSSFHNVKVFEDINSNIVPLAYDFNQTDISSLYSAEGRNRLYSHRGLSCLGTTEGLLKAEAQRLLGLGQEILKLVDNNTFLSQSDRRFVSSYVRGRLTELDNIKNLKLTSKPLINATYLENGTVLEEIDPYLCSFDFI